MQPLPQGQDCQQALVPALIVHLASQQRPRWMRHRRTAVTTLASMPLDAMFNSGELVVVTDGILAGTEAHYQTADADRRAFILLEILSKSASK